MRNIKPCPCNDIHADGVRCLICKVVINDCCGVVDFDGYEYAPYCRYCYELNKFKHYIKDFYQLDTASPELIGVDSLLLNRVITLYRENCMGDSWGGGDSVDRERIASMLIALGARWSS